MLSHGMSTPSKQNKFTTVKRFLKWWKSTEISKHTMKLSQTSSMRVLLRWELQLKPLHNCLIRRLRQRASLKIPAMVWKTVSRPKTVTWTGATKLKRKLSAPESLRDHSTIPVDSLKSMPMPTTLRDNEIQWSNVDKNSWETTKSCQESSKT